MSVFRCFVMMPFGNQWSDDLFSAIKSAAAMISEHTIKVDRADLGQPLDISTLERHITQHIEKADFGIAEISDHNPNVMLEVGLTIARDKPVILMVRKGCGAPVNLRGGYWFEYELEKLASIPSRLAQFIAGAIDQVQASEVRPEYWAKVYSKRDHTPLARTIQEAKKRILIHTTNLDWLITSDTLNAIIKKIDECSSVQVRILVLEPESDFAADRARQLALDVREFRTQLRASLDYVKKALAPFGERCKIATYSEFPTQIVLIVDGMVFCGVVSANRRARENVVIRLSMGHSNVKESFWDHYNTVWKRSELVGGGKPGFLP